MSESIFEQAVVIDAACPLANVKGTYKLWMQGGATAICPTVAMEEDAAKARQNMAAWQREIERNDALLLVRKAEDILAAKRQNRLGIIMHFQNSKPLGRDLSLIPDFHAQGLRIVQLCYNVQNDAGYGSSAAKDKGLTPFGEQLIRQLEQTGIAVDVTHTGYRTTMEALEAAAKPVICTHSNAYAVCPSERNIKDDQIKAIARRGGVIGLNGYPAFVAAQKRPAIDDLLDHADHMARLVGVDHIALGLDYWQGQAGIASLPLAWLIYLLLLIQGRWSPKAYPPPPWHQPAGIETPDKLRNLVQPLLARGYSAEDIAKILGGNWLRVFGELW